MSRVLVPDGLAFDLNDYFDAGESVQQQLRLSRKRLGLAWCACTSPPRALVIRQVRGRLWLAVWPLDGPRHDPACQFYRDPAPFPDTPAASTAAAEDSPPEAPAWAVAEGLGQEFDSPQESAAVSAPRQPPAPAPASTSASASASAGEFAEAEVLHLRFTLQRRAATTRPPNVKASQESTGPANGSALPATPTGLGLQGLFGELWSRTRLNAWWPHWSRNWWRVRRELQTAAASMCAGGELLADCLFVPWTANQADQDEAEGLARFDGRLAQGSSGLIVAELVSLERARRGWILRLRASQRLAFVDNDAHTALQRRFPRAISALNGSVPWAGTIVGLLLVQRSRRGDGWSLTGAHIALADSRWIPCHSQREIDLTDRLAAANRGFVRHLAGDAPVDRAAATAADYFVVSDCRPPVAIWPRSDAGAVGRQRETQIRAEAREAGLDLVVWDPSGPLPDLPAPARAPRRGAKAG